jgi:HEAT repeat protein
MLKFQFMRMEEPVTPDTARAETNLEWPDADGVSRYQWDWLHGASDSPSAENGVDSATAIEQLLGDDESTRLQATYALAGIGEPAVPPLVDALREEAAQHGESKTAKSPANPAGGNPADLATAHALAALGPSAIDALVDLSTHSHWAVRATAVDVLGTIGSPVAAAAPTIRQALQDENVWVRRNAAEALGILSDANSTGELATALKDEDWRVRLNAAGALARIGPEANSSTRDVSPLLDDENRYVRANAIQALERFASPEATDALLHHLMSARWCSLTSKDSKY